jgi:hypothetical protein
VGSCADQRWVIASTSQCSRANRSRRAKPLAARLPGTGGVAFAADDQQLAMGAHGAGRTAGADRHPLRRPPARQPRRDAAGALRLEPREVEASIEERVPKNGRPARRCSGAGNPRDRGPVGRPRPIRVGKRRAPPLAASPWARAPKNAVLRPRRTLSASDAPEPWPRRDESSADPGGRAGPARISLRRPCTPTSTDETRGRSTAWPRTSSSSW